MPGKHKKKHRSSASNPAPTPQKKSEGPPKKSEEPVNESPPDTQQPVPASQTSFPLSSTPGKVTEVKMAPKPSGTRVQELPDFTEAPVLIAVRYLLGVIENYNGTTVNGLVTELKQAKEDYTADLGHVQSKSKLSVKSACAQFIRYATLTLSSIETEDMLKCREQVLSEGMKYLKRCERSIEKIARWAVTLIFDGARILVHSDSLVVLETLRSVPKNIYFSVYVVIDDDSFAKFFEENYNIDVKTIRDAEIGTLMEIMDLVLVGAEAVLKNGGIINKVGTLPLAICAHEMNKPMYVLAESFKFSMMYPMSQSDLPNDIRENSVTKRIRVDYTLPKYITFLVTDRGLLTPTAVCDELIELYT